MAAPLIWQLTPDRAKDWRSIRLEALTLSPDAFGSKLADWQDRPLDDFADRLRAVETWAAGDRADMPLAVAGWQPGWTPGTEDMGWITGVYTRPAARARGLMLALLNHIAGRAAAAGMTRLGLHVWTENLAAQRTYIAAGFAVTSPPFIGDLGKNESEMQRPLTKA